MCAHYDQTAVICNKIFAIRWMNEWHEHESLTMAAAAVIFSSMTVTFCVSFIYFMRNEKQCDRFAGWYDCMIQTPNLIWIWCATQIANNENNETIVLLNFDQFIINGAVAMAVGYFINHIRRIRFFGAFVLIIANTWYYACLYSQNNRYIYS